MFKFWSANNYYISNKLLDVNELLLLLPPVQFLDFVRVNFVMQLSRNLPTQLVGFDAQWPHAPQALQETSDILREMYRLYLARKFMRKLSPDDREQVCIS